MSFISQQTIAVTGQVLTASIWNAEFQNIITTFNGGIDNVNIASGAGISYSKLDLNNAIQDGDLAGGIAKEKITNIAVTETDTQTITNKTLTSPVVNRSVQPITTVAYAGSLDFDLDVSNQFFTELTGNPIITFTNGADGQAFIIHLKQDGSGSRTVSWPTIKWAGGTTPTMTTDIFKIDTFGFIKNGADYYGYVIGLKI